MRYAFLGPEGTFCEAALRQFDPGAEAVPSLDVTSALEAVREGTVDGAMVPIENSVEGGVNATIDTLSKGRELAIVGEVVIPVQFVLAVRPGTELADVTRIGTHSHAWAQCRQWIHTNLPNAVHVTTGSTAAGAAELAAGTDAFDAALCSALSVETYGLVPVAAGVADNPGAVTRFVAVALPKKLPAPTGSDKTTLMVQLGHNEAGGLLEMLEQFSVRGVNLSRIESRPIGDSLGRYAFSIDAEGHIREERMQAVLIGLHRISPEVRFIGSYPAAERRVIKRRPGTSDADFVQARAWVTSILNGVEGSESQILGAAPPAGDAKSRILHAARVEFSRHGYSGASIRQVAASAEVDAGLVGYHFGSKAKLFEAAIDGVFESLAQLADFVVGRVVANADAPDPALAVTAELQEEFERRGTVLFERDMVTVLRTLIRADSGPDATREDVIARVKAMMEQSAPIVGSLFHAQAIMALLLGLLFGRVVAQVRPLNQVTPEQFMPYVATRFIGIARLDTAGLLEIPASPQSEPIDVAQIVDTRSRILAVARERFALWGYAGTSLREIASLARCDISLIHYYFGSKLGLFEATVDVPFGSVGVVRRNMDNGVIELEAVLSDLLAMWSSSEEGAVLRSLLSTAADPETEAVGELVRGRLQRLFDEAIEPRDAKGTDFPFYVLGAEAIGYLIMRDVIKAEPFAKLSDAAIVELLSRTVRGIPWLVEALGNSS